MLITGRPVSTVGVARSIRGNTASNGIHAAAALGVRRVWGDRVGPLALGDVAQISRKDGAEVGTIFGTIYGTMPASITPVNLLEEVE